MGYIGAGISRFNTADELTVTGDAQIDTTTLVVDSTNNRVGVNNSAPSTALEVDADGATVLTVDRATSDGTIIELQKDGTTVGSIKSQNSTDISIGSADTELRFFDSGDQIIPTTDNLTTLGRFDSRFKDLYLSGGAYLGGTAAANQLDDYEEGSFTPTLTFGGGSTGMTFSSQQGRYTKIGNMCTVYVEMNLSNKGSSTGSVLYGGLPFTAANDIQDRAVALQMFRNVPSGSDNLAHLFHVFPQNNQSNCILRSTISTGDAGPDDTDYDNNTKVSFTLTYKTA